MSVVEQMYEAKDKVVTPHQKKMILTEILSDMLSLVLFSLN